MTEALQFYDDLLICSVSIVSKVFLFAEVKTASFFVYFGWSRVNTLEDNM